MTLLRPDRWLARRLLGDEGERVAARFLRAKHYRILGRNYRTPRGEVDIIALHEGALVFVEVKTLRDDSLRDAEDTVNAEKMRRIQRAARIFVHRYHLERFPARFDVLALTPATAGDPWRVEHFEDAFR